MTVPDTEVDENLTSTVQSVKDTVEVSDPRCPTIKKENKIQIPHDASTYPGQKRYLWPAMKGESAYKVSIMAGWPLWEPTAKPAINSSELEKWVAKNKNDIFLSDAVIVLQNFFWGEQPATPRRFLEVGALDGLSGSNSWPYDSYLGWEGLLIEVTSENFNKLIKRREGTYRVQVALCESSKPVKMTGEGGCCSGIDSSMSANHAKAFFRDRGTGGTVLCVPLTLVMEALGWTKLDFWSLDVEGAELDVLKGSKGIQVDVIIVENLIGDDKRKLVRDLLQDEWGLTFWDLRKRERGFTQGILNEVYYNSSSIQPVLKDLL